MKLLCMDEKHLSFIGDLPSTNAGRKLIVKDVTQNILAGKRWDHGS